MLLKFKIIIIIASVIINLAGLKFQGEFMDGDLIFQESQSSQAEALFQATGSRYTHMGIIFFQNNEPFVYEAVQPVSVTTLNKWIKRGKNSHYTVKRLKNRDKLLARETLEKMRIIGKGFLNKNYDNLFEWSDQSIYCSELVWKIYKRGAGIEIGELQKFKDFKLNKPAVKALIKKRYGNKISENELVVSPVSMFDSALLETVYTSPR